MQDKIVPYIPDPEKIKELYERIDKGEKFELDWQNPGRRPPTPDQVEESSDKTEDAGAGDCQEAADQTMDFDFDDEGGAPNLMTPHRRTPGSNLKGSARKQTTSLDSVLSNMKRHKKIEELMETTGDNKSAAKSPSEASAADGNSSTPT